MIEKHCIVSFKHLNANETLITEGISLWDRTVQFLNVDFFFTNVTIKDELENYYITQMLKYGELIPGSVRRGYI